MSVVVKDPNDGMYKLYCKGADSIIKERLCIRSNDPDELTETDSFLRRSSIQGYRTLLVAMKVIDQRELNEFLNKCKRAENDLLNRDEKLA